MEKTPGHGEGEKDRVGVSVLGATNSPEGRSSALWNATSQTLRVRIVVRLLVCQIPFMLVLLELGFGAIDDG